MKNLLLTTIAAVLLVGCGESQQSASAPESKPVEPVAEDAQPEPSTGKAPEISIHKAAGEGNIEVVKQHLAAGTDVNVRRLSMNDELKIVYGETPLHMAVSEGKKETAELLIAQGADVNAKNEGGETPLNLASTKEVSELLIAEGADVNAKDDDGMTPLHSAAYAGHKEVAELLIVKDADLNAKDIYNRTPLHIADEEVVELLIAEGADVNAKDDDGMTPLHNAAIEGHKEIAELLVVKGADVNAKDDDGKTPLDDAEEVWEDASSEDKAAKKETANLIRKHGGKSGAEDSIHAAARIGNIEAVQQHLGSGVDVNTKNKLGRTPMLYAIQGGHKEIVKLLIAKGAIQVPRFSIIIAATDGDIEAVKQHLAVGTYIDATNSFKETALHVAAFFGEKEIAKLLVANGANVNARGFLGITPLDNAVGNTFNDKNNAEIADLLRKHGGKTGAELKAEGK